MDGFGCVCGSGNEIWAGCWFSIEVALDVPLDFVVTHYFENLAAKTALYSEASLWRLLQSVNT